MSASTVASVAVKVIKLVSQPLKKPQKNLKQKPLADYLDNHLNSVPYRIRRTIPRRRWYMELERG